MVDNNDSFTPNQQDMYPAVYYLAPNKLPRGSEYVFCLSKVKKWSTARIHAWKNKHLYPDAFYYRFVDPDQYQTNGGFSPEEHEEFMEQIKIFTEKGWLGTSWGVFSLGVPHKAGYQCSAYYKSLLEKRRLTDPAYAFIEGKLTMIDKTRKKLFIPAHLSPCWNDTKVKNLSKQIDIWVSEFHNNPSILKPTKITSPTKVNKSRTGKIKSLLYMASTISENSDSDFDQLPKKQKTAENTEFSPSLITSFSSLEISTRSKDLPYDSTTKFVTDSSIDFDVKLLTKSAPDKDNLNLVASPPLEIASSKTNFLSFFEQQPFPKSKSKTTAPNRQSVCIANKSKQADLSLFWKDVKPPPAEGPEPSIYKIPDVVPPTWANLIRPLSFLNQNVSFNISKTVPDVFSLNSEYFIQLDPNLCRKKNGLEGILVDPPWPDCRLLGKKTVKALKTLLSEMVKLLRSGFVFLWAPKVYQLECLNIAAALDLRYVENLVWCKVSLENQFTAQDSEHFRSSKTILLIFKKGEEVEIRHQRSSDVVFDFEKPKTSWNVSNLSSPKPWFVYEMIETLLPKAKPSDSGLRLLELWAKVGLFSPPRSGWIQIHQNSHQVFN